MPIHNSNPGLLSCSRYAFAPNFYQYCGPDKNKALKDYLKAQTNDQGLIEMLEDFETLYPYLQFIAQANKIKNPFDARVVEAYWLGNQLLENIKIKDLYQFIKENFARKVPKKILNFVYPKLDKGARVNHAFHVLNIFKRTGHLAINHTLETMDNCRIGWGKVLKTPPRWPNGLLGGEINKKLIVLTQSLIYQNNKLVLGKPMEKQIIDQFNLSRFLKIGDFVSFHWGYLCDKLTPIQVKNLYYYTHASINLANLTI